jgi:multidrug efflux pump
MSRFFIDRPIFAWVIAIVIMLAGALSILRLPISQYPEIAPPAVGISALFPGSSAQTLQDTVTQIVEQSMTGLDGLSYITSTSDSTGRLRVTLTFEAGINPDIAQVQVQNKLALAIPKLPLEVQRQGLTVDKSTPGGYLMIFGVVSDDPNYKSSDIADYLTTNLQDPLSRVNGVGEVRVFGSSYAMRIWMNPDKLVSFKLTPADVRAAITSQNVQISAGELGAAPAVPGQMLNASVTMQSLFRTPEQFENILLKANPDGSTVRLKDVARVELGSEQYTFNPRWNGQPASGIGIQLATGANALETAQAVKDVMAKMSASFPKGMRYGVALDTTPFVKVSIEGVVKTLIEAVALVFVVMYLFLQNFRATLIPTIAVPVVILGTFGVLAAAGFTINTLTMFAMVLAIGLLVDDAIVVVENVERLMHEEGLPPLEATRKSMDQITGALVGIGLVLSAVFIPMAFFGGSVGVIYRQFSITIVSAMALSVIVALVLTPALCATMLKPVVKNGFGHDANQHSEQHLKVKSGNLLDRFFVGFNRRFDAGALSYQTNVGKLLTRPVRMLLIYGLLIAGMVVLFLRMPTSFLPDEDQGQLFTQVNLPPGATQERTFKVMSDVEKFFLEKEKGTVDSLFTVVGFSFSGTGQNSGTAFIRMRDWGERPGPEGSVKGVAARAKTEFDQYTDGRTVPFAPPPIRALGNAAGFSFYLQDRGGLGREALVAARNDLLAKAKDDPLLSSVRPNGLEDTPQFNVKVDQSKAVALGLDLAAVNDALATAWSGRNVNDFLDKGRVKKVYLQGDAPYRMKPEDLNKWHVRNKEGEMVPFSAFATGSWTLASPRLERYNGVPALEIQGQAAPGKSTGEALKAIERIAATLPEGFGIEWTGLSYQEKQSGSQAPALYALSLLVVFLCLAALYESWSIPFAVMLIVPLGVIGALAASFGRGYANDVFFQVALLTTVGLSAKNAILIVEFAKAEVDSGMDLVQATLKAVKLRLRPILMTSLAFGLGVLPLAIATGAGSGSQNAIGTGVLGGTISATVLGLFFVPLFYVLVSKISPSRSSHGPVAAPAVSASSGGQHD